MEGTAGTPPGAHGAAYRLQHGGYADPTHALDKHAFAAVKLAFAENGASPSGVSTSHSFLLTLVLCVERSDC